MTQVLDAAATAAALPWVPLAEAIARVAQDPQVRVPTRLVMPLDGGGHLFAMPAADARVAITKLITLTPANAGTGHPTIQGDVVVFDVPTGARLAVLDGPTVTARRTAAVSLCALRHLAPGLAGPLLVVGAGVQGRAHLEALSTGLGLNEVWVASARAASADALVRYAQGLGLTARRVDDLARAAANAAVIVTATPAQAVVLHGPLRPDAVVVAVGAYTPHMQELDPALCRWIATHGQIVLDTRDADHEAGDVLQAGLPVSDYPHLGTVLAQPAPQKGGPLLFKSCGWGGWDLAAAQLVVSAL